MVFPQNLEDLYSSDTYKATLAELVGSCLLVVSIGGTTAGATVGTAHLAFALSYGFTVASLTFAIGYVSGGHLNPGISFGHFLLRRISAFKLVAYWSGQFVGGGLGAGILYAIIPREAWTKEYMIPAIPQTSNTMIALSWELISSFLVSFVFLNVMDDIKRIGKYGPISVGLAFAAATMSSSAFSGASMNPATRSLNLQIAGGYVDASVWVYFVGCLCAGSIAALCTKIIRPSTDKLLRALSQHDFPDFDAAQNFAYDFH